MEGPPQVIPASLGELDLRRIPRDLAGSRAVLAYDVVVHNRRPVVQV